MSLIIIPLYLCMLVAFFLPGSALIAELARRTNPPRPLYALILLLITSATVGYIAFWIYFAGRREGRIFTFAVELASAWLLYRSLRYSSSARLLLRDLSVPIFFVAAVGACYLSTLYIPANPFLMKQDLANWRFFTPVRPGDNVIPWIFAQKIYQHQSLIPFCCGDWLSSDRPPLQTGIFLFCWPLKITSAELSYQLLGSGLQCLWICGIWAILQALGAPQVRFLQILGFLAPSAFLLYNSVYVWPKLLAAVFILLAFAIVISTMREARRMTAGETALGAACVGLALVAHSGSLFSLSGLMILAIARRSIRWQTLGWSALVLCGFYLPWVAYQKYVDPPGNRLIKMHVAGVIPIDSRSAWEAIRDSYRNTPITRIIENKFDNLTHVIGPHPFSGIDLREPRSYDYGAVDYREGVRVDQREYIWNALGILILGLLVIPISAIRKLKPAIPYSGLILACVAINIAVWSIGTFGPFETVTTHSSYADILLLMLVLSGFLLMTSRWLGSAVALLNAATTAVVWISFRPNSPAVPSQVQWPLVCFSAASGLALVAYLIRSFFQPDEVAVETQPKTFTAKVWG